MLHESEADRKQGKQHMKGPISWSGKYEFIKKEVSTGTLYSERKPDALLSLIEMRHKKTHTHKPLLKPLSFYTPSA